MREWFKRALMALTAMVSIVAGVAVAANPAQASSVYGCGDGWICFYNYESFNSAGGIWGHRIYGAGNWNTCITMPSSGIAGWTGGTTYNAATSIVINNSGTNTLEAYPKFYDGYNCSGSEIPLVEHVLPNSLNLDMWRLANYTAPGGNWNDRIGSFLINTNF